ncbi:MAG: hypothetical protein ACJ8HI_01615 [Massilia sp.]
MNTFSRAAAVAAATAADARAGAAHHERRDARSRDIVDHAIVVQETSNTMSAVEYLKSHDVASHVIERVLLEPHRRRNAIAA